MAFSLWNWQLPPPNTSNFSNFQSFLDSVTPTVPNLYATEQTRGTETASCFLLSDLWNSCLQKSVYGTGVPILLESGESIMQYYSPSLSAIQIYTCEPANCRSESHMSNMLSRTLNTTSDDTIIGEKMDRFGYLYYQYNETSSPYDRLPLCKKISELAQSNHGLVNFKSVDLSPYSWIAIAWYPISQIPVMGNMKDLAACFLTYHTLSTCFGESEHAYNSSPGKEQNVHPQGMKFKLKGSHEEQISLPPFAVSSYKMFGGLWQNPRTSDQANAAFHRRAALSWLKGLGFHHSDSNFFYSRQTNF